MVESAVIKDNVILVRINKPYSAINGSVSSIRGVVRKLGVNLPCRVRLYEKQTGIKVDEILTDEFGNYVFTNLEKIKFFIIAHDPLSQYNAVIQDNVVPK